MKNIITNCQCKTAGKLAVAILTHIRQCQGVLCGLPTQWERGSGARCDTSVWLLADVAQRARAELRALGCAHSPIGAVAALLERASADPSLTQLLVNIGRPSLRVKKSTQSRVEVTASVEAEVVAYAVANDITIKQAATYLLSSHPVLMAIRQAADQEPVVVLDDVTSEAQALS